MPRIINSLVNFFILDFAYINYDLKGSVNGNQLDLKWFEYNYLSLITDSDP